MEVSNILNNPITFVLSGKQYRVKRLSLLDLFAEFEVDVKAQYMDDVVDMASRIKDIKERIKFQCLSLKDMPKGKELEDQSRDIMGSYKGGLKLLYMALSKCNNITQDEVNKISSDPANTDVITNLMNYITGTDVDLNKKAVEIPVGATVIQTEKKT